MTLDTCVYCGRESKLEPDHVVPRSLFTSVNQSKVIVPSCRACNVHKSRGEGDLRDYLVFHKDSSQHSEAQRLIGDTLKSASKGFSALVKSGSPSQLRPYLTPAGIYLGDAYLAEVDTGPMNESLNYITRGLYYHETGAVLDPNCPVEVMHVGYEQRANVFHQLGRLPHPSPRVLGREVFWWVPYLTYPLSEKSIWLMVFFDQVVIVGKTGQKPVSDTEVPNASKARKRARRVEKRLQRIGLVLSKF